MSAPRYICVGCGELITRGSRCAECKPKRTAPATHHPALSTHRWQRLSKRLRASSPFCEQCNASERLQVDHIIPVTEDVSLAYVIENLRVLCAPCNGRRKDQCTDDERAAVHARIAARKARASRHATCGNARPRNAVV
ncbi:HNH endonuclease signature motif containing protein [Mycobacterium sp. ZZG]